VRDLLAMANPKALLLGLHSDDSAQDLIEYGLVAALIALAAVAGMNTMSAAVNTAFNHLAEHISNNLRAPRHDD
jgi:pilus assembly protein Flp/PilA